MAPAWRTPGAPWHLENGGVGPPARQVGGRQVTLRGGAARFRAPGCADDAGHLPPGAQRRHVQRCVPQQVARQGRSSMPPAQSCWYLLGRGAGRAQESAAGRAAATGAGPPGKRACCRAPAGRSICSAAGARGAAQATRMCGRSRTARARRGAGGGKGGQGGSVHGLPGRPATDCAPFQLPAARKCARNSAAASRRAVAQRRRGSSRLATLRDPAAGRARQSATGAGPALPRAGEAGRRRPGIRAGEAGRKI